MPPIMALGALAVLVAMDGHPIVISMIVSSHKISVGVLDEEFDHFFNGTRNIKIIILCEIDNVGDLL